LLICRPNVFHSSFLAGILPLSFSLSHSQLRFVSTIGMGVLVGTCLIVIIPEGIDTLYTAANPSLDHIRRQSHYDSLDVRWSNDVLTHHPPGYLIEREDHTPEAIDSLPGPVSPDAIDSGAQGSKDPPKTPTTPGEVGALQSKPEPQDPDPPAQSRKTDRNPHAWVGLTLVLGFILMYLIDTLPALKPPAPPQRMNIYSLSDLSATASTHPTPKMPRSSFSTTLGLIIHAAADGIALGASSSRASLSLIIFLAIMIHKAPAAFGLTSVLLKQGLGKRQARVHLLAFSLAAPLGAIATWLVVQLLGGGGNLAGEDSMRWWTGILLLFSGGTFL
jgi:solute carrier family 39 (zinc transporter), member 9